MLMYLAAPYSRVDDKHIFMEKFMKFSARYMMEKRVHIVSPLFNHYSMIHVPEMETDWNAWGAYSEDLLTRCDGLIVLCLPGWKESSGVQAEIDIANKHGILVSFIDEQEYNSYNR